jgi:hypothetical protein
MAASLQAFESRPLEVSDYRELSDLLTSFGEELVNAAEADGDDIDADAFDDLMSSIAYFQDRILETQPN